MVSILQQIVGFDKDSIKKILDTIPAGISIATDASCKEIRHNKKAAEFLRIQPWENLSHTDSEDQPAKLFHKGEKLSPEDMPIQRSAWKGEEVNGFEIEFVWEDGVHKTSLWNSCPLFDDNGSIIGAIASFEDITQRKRVEADLATFEEKYISLHESIQDAFASATMDGKIYECNNVFLDFLGYSKEELQSLTYMDLTPKKWHPMETEILERMVLTRGFSNVYEKEYQRKDGTVFPVELKTFIIRDQAGNPLFLWAIVRDITERKQVEEILKRDKQQLEELVKERTRELCELSQRLLQTIESITDAFFTLDNEWRVTYWNRAAENMFNLKRKDILGRDFWEVFPKSIGSDFYNQYHLAMNENRSVKFEALGTYTARWVEARAYPSKLGLTIYLNDITERKQAQEALSQSEERFNKLYNENPFPMLISSMKDGTCLEVNDSFIKASGYSREEIIGFRAIDQDHWVDQEERYKIIKEIELKGYVNNFEVRFRAKSREVRLCLISGIKINLYGKECILTITNDITELRRYQNEIAHLDRLNLVGEMAAGIGHEVRNPMTTIKGLLQLLGEKEKYAEEREYFDLMVDELDRANSIITEFLSLAKNKAVDLKLKKLNKILKSILPLIQADGLVTNKYIELKTKKIPDLLLDEKEIRQLVLNLVRNGLQAMEPGKTLTLETFMEENNIVLAVKDQGSGIPDDIIDKIGTPFFTTKDSGTGLGLAVCYSIAARHNAKIDIETGPKGTTFFVRFRRPE